MADESVDSLKTIYLFRSTVQITSKGDDGMPAIGERGFLVVGNATLFAIERIKIGQANCVRLPKKLLRCTMEQSSKVGRAFRIEGSGDYGHNIPMPGDHNQMAAFMIHSANYPHEVQGCIAPGLGYLDNGVDKSRDAMQQIFTYCGGWGVGKQMMIDIDDL